MIKERDELRGRFTRFMEVSVKHAKADYLQSLRSCVETVPIDHFVKDLPAPQTDPASSGSFEFDDVLLEREFLRLPPSQRLVLTLLFVEGASPQTIAGALGCSTQHIYNQRSQALKRLRQALEEENHDQR